MQEIARAICSIGLASIGAWLVTADASGWWAAPLFVVALVLALNIGYVPKREREKGRVADKTGG